MNEPHVKQIAENRKARHEYFIVDTYEAGLVLVGTEVKALREGRANLKDAYAKVQKGELWIYQLHISAYSHASYDNHEPLRPRKLLLHRDEIKRLVGKINEAGHTLVPLRLYFKSGRVKLLLALAKGKRKYDKRDAIRRREEQRDLDRARKTYR